MTEWCSNGSTSCLWYEIEHQQDLIGVWKKFFLNKPLPTWVRYWNSVPMRDRNTHGLLNGFGVTVPQAKNIYPPLSSVSNCNVSTFKGTYIESYTSATSPTIAEYEHLNNVSNVVLMVDRTKAISIKYYGKTKPPALSYQTQIEDWEKGYSINRRESLNCLPFGWYWVVYKATFNVPHKNTQACSIDSFRRSKNMTISKYTAQNSTTIKKYESDNGVTGTSLTVDRSQVLGKEYIGTREPSILPYDTQISNWEHGFTEDRMNTVILKIDCAPAGWYLVKYAAKFNKGTEEGTNLPVHKKFHIHDFELIIGILASLATLVVFMDRKR